ncbi:MAG: N-6 DNA methylase, partial [Anaerolineae bacterium]|nr:N-6 DNA methylase [Anaerolineae bacterium]
FNGSLFDDTAVEPLSHKARSKLADASRLNWASVEPAIFGTLFERSLDPAKRAQLGAHYTSRDDILLIVEPVLMLPLRREWTQIQAQAAPIREKFDSADTPRARLAAQKELDSLRETMLHRLRTVRVLDPACGSGNFLYVALGLLMNLEKEVILHPLWHGLSQPMPEVHPRQLYGIEINPIAHALASIVVWIGFIQWKQTNGYYPRLDPILEDLHDNIRLMDAILTLDADGQPAEPDWPEVDVIVGNPPFLGGNKIRQELGGEIDKLFSLYEGRVPASADLVCYWFERARAHLEQGKARRAGLLATNSIRGGVNRAVLNRIKQTGDIFMAWADRSWVLEGAAVRVSMVGFDKGEEKEVRLDGLDVTTINPDLTATVDITSAKVLKENANICFRTDEKGGAFDIPQVEALSMLQAENQSGRSNTDVIQRWVNGLDITRRPRNMWIIDFGTDTTLEEAILYEKPFRHVEKYVKPAREINNIERLREKWWLHRVPGADMRAALSKLLRYIVTPSVAKHRLFVWLDNSVLPDHQLYAFAREDDYFFGVLHSRLHEVWSLRMGTWLGKGNDPRYTPTTT